jgi:hypothetical protein
VDRERAVRALAIAAIGVALGACSGRPATAVPADPDASGQAGGDGGAGSDGGVDGAMIDGGGAGSRIGMFVAYGAKARTTISCDDGKSWIADRSDDATTRCGAGVDCDHDALVGHGLAMGAGWFVANFGHGPAGTIRRSQDGVTWTVVDSARAYAAMLVGGGRLLAEAAMPLVSTDDGHSWAAATKPDTQGREYRGGAYSGTQFAIVGDGPFAAFSSDGQAWTQHPPPAACDVLREVAGGGGAVIVLGTPDLVCRTADGGATWTTATIGEQGKTVVWTGTRFLVFGPTHVYSSSDGASWTAAALVHRVNGEPVAAPPAIAEVGAAPGGTLVAVTPPPQSYESQRFFRSADGVTWDELPTTAFAGGHPIHGFAWGMGVTSAACHP